MFYFFIYFNLKILLINLFLFYFYPNYIRSIYYILYKGSTKSLAISPKESETNDTTPYRTIPSFNLTTKEIFTETFSTLSVSESAFLLTSTSISITNSNAFLSSNISTTIRSPKTGDSTFESKILIY